MSSFHSIPKSFGYAWSGLKTALKNEPNFRVHTVIATAVIVLGVVLSLSRTEWMIVALIICWVLVLELVNTAMEAVVNIVSPDIAEGAKQAKDTIAAAVLISAIGAVAVGLLLFVPKIVAVLAGL